MLKPILNRFRNGTGEIVGLRQHGSSLYPISGRFTIGSPELPIRKVTPKLVLVISGGNPAGSPADRCGPILREGEAFVFDHHIPPPVPVRAPEVFLLQSEGAIALDTRPAMQFAVAHVPGSVHIALSGQYASWAARILGLDKRIILVGEDADHLRESQLRLARVGIENVHAYLEDGITGWILGGYELDYIPQISVQEFTELLEQEKDRIVVLDVRERGEVEAGAMENSVRIPLGQLQDRTAELDRDKLIVVHCKGGYRSSIATSILRRAGFRDIANLTGGFDAWSALKASAGQPSALQSAAGR